LKYLWVLVKTLRSMGGDSQSSESPQNKGGNVNSKNGTGGKLKPEFTKKGQQQKDASKLGRGGMGG